MSASAQPTLPAKRVDVREADVGLVTETSCKNLSCPGSIQVVTAEVAISTDFTGPALPRQFV